ncbi:MAG: hypothetical protein D6726_05460 [Nitrospirae bacterium]|nr:MAG: hypothetical protein D6726_05460 [Nitrospirota bacterium]
MRFFTCFTVLMMVLGIVSMVEAQVFNVSDQTGFQNALTTAQSNNEDDVINVQADMTITSTLTYQTDTGDNGHTLTINGNGHTLDGGNAVQIMYIETDTGHNVVIQVVM